MALAGVSAGGVRFLPGVVIEGVSGYVGGAVDTVIQRIGSALCT